MRKSRDRSRETPGSAMASLSLSLFLSLSPCCAFVLPRRGSRQIGFINDAKVRDGGNIVAAVSMRALYPLKRPMNMKCFKVHASELVFARPFVVSPKGSRYQFLG